MLVLVSLVAIVSAAGTSARGTTAAKVDPRVLADSANGRKAHFLVVLERQGDARRAAAQAVDRAGQGRLVVTTLREAAGAQEDARAELRRLGAPFRSYWIVDALAVEGTRAVVDAMAARSDVQAIEPDRAFQGAADTVAESVAATPAGVEWNVERIGAPAVWALGARGQDVVYANADTGVQWDHPALKSHYRGWNGTTATHDYNWWDAIHADIDGDGGSMCGFSSKVPCDDDPGSHGTHTAGTAVGDDGAGNQIGVAPGARWMSCRNMDNGTGRPSTYIECLQFFLAPTDLNGANPDPSKRPNVVSNSYDCPPDEGCSIGSLQTAVDNMRAAGIFMTVAAGNGGRNGCGSVATPPGAYDSSVTVGATDSSDAIAAFSSRGPVLADGSGRTKPDLVAPGVGVRSSTRAGYDLKSGTSMATPHVAGAVLLLWSAFPSLRGNVDGTEQLLERTARGLPTTDGCGGNTAAQIPNNTYGYGRIDVLAAYRSAEAAAPLSVSIADVSVTEGNAGTKDARFPVTLARPSAQAVSVQFATAAGAAQAGSDYRATSGTLTFAPGETAKTIAVPVIGDRAIEPDEDFFVLLSAPAGAGLTRNRATGLIANDDVDRVKPVLSALTVGRPGPRVRYRLSEDAVITFTISRGTRVVGRFSRRETQGRHSLVLTTKLLGRALAPGDYRLVAVPRDAAGNAGKPTAARFTIPG